MIRVSILIFLFILTDFQGAFAQTKGCQILPSEAVSMADRVIKRLYFGTPRTGEHALVMPDNLTINNEVMGGFDKMKSKAHHHVRYEALLRPKKTGFFHMLGIVLFKLDRSRNFLYVCVNDDSEKIKETHLSIYFMHAYGLEPEQKENLANLPGDWFWGPGGVLKGAKSSVVKLTRLPVILTPVHFLTNDALNILEPFPWMSKLLLFPSAFLQFSGEVLNSINEKLGLGVQRILVRPNVIEFANFVDENNPEKATTLFTLKRERKPTK